MKNLEDVKSIYFVGIGGIAMSAVACLAKQRGYEVSGSDSQAVYDPAKSVLDRLKISYHLGYDAAHVSAAAADLYVLSAGESETNPEVKEILAQGLARCGFAELLHEMFKDSLRIVVAGTHGKSTTAGLLGHLLRHQDNSSYIVGGVLQNYQSNFYAGDGHYAVFEGDEYKAQFDDPTPKFQYYKPDILVLTNLELDHPDVFSSVEELEDEFRQLIAGLPEDGLVVYNADDARLTRLVHETDLTSVSFGIENAADLQAESLEYGEYTKFKVKNSLSKDATAKLLGLTEDYQIQLPGQLNVYNALACVACLRALGFQPESFALDLLSYAGIKRRFELVGSSHSAVLIDDYAHHPTAVKETLAAARLKYPGSRVWAIFEPHTFSRTKATLPELAGSFDEADCVLISEIYPARESVKDASVTSGEVIDAIKKHMGQKAEAIRLVKDKDEALKILKAELRPGDVVVVMAVGNFNRLAYELKETKNAA
ncbi:MAG: UDP-N-acetylmuramate--L-alanine ligase [Patescibacteria group bacterium]|nr:UDP-N-acetylmuramate--L-alanine ligase [Patescibacteria group bacterium]